MATKRFHRITSSLLAGLMFLTSTGFSLDVHFCQGQFKNLSLFGEARSCHEALAPPSCHAEQPDAHVHLQTGEPERDCCENKQLEFSPDDTERVLVEILQPGRVPFLTAFIAVPFNPLATERIPHLHYRPPPLDRDLVVLVQSFLI